MTRRYSQCLSRELIDQATVDIISLQYLIMLRELPDAKRLVLTLEADED